MVFVANFALHKMSSFLLFIMIIVPSVLQYIAVECKKRILNEKSTRRRRKHCALAVVKGGAKNFRPAADPLPGGAGRPKFNQLEMVTTFTYQLPFW